MTVLIQRRSQRMAVMPDVKLVLALVCVCHGISSLPAQEPENPPVRESLAERMFVPTSGHYELFQPTGPVHLEFEIDSMDDVVALHRKLSRMDYAEKSVRTRQFLDLAEVKRLPEGTLRVLEGDKLVEVPPKMAGMVVTVDFDTEHHAYENTYLATGSRNRTVLGPVSTVSVRKSAGNPAQVSHRVSQEKSSLREQYDTKRIFSRSKEMFSTAQLLGPLEKGQLYSQRFNSGENLVWVDPETDAIYARAFVTRRNQFNSIVLHLGHEEVKAPRPHRQPKVTLEFRRHSTYWTIRTYLVRSANFEDPPAIAAFQVPLHGGETYVYDRTARRTVLKIPDIMPLAPAEVIARDNRARRGVP